MTPSNEFVEKQVFGSLLIRRAVEGNGILLIGFRVLLHVATPMGLFDICLANL